MCLGHSVITGVSSFQGFEVEGFDYSSHFIIDTWISECRLCVLRVLTSSMLSIASVHLNLVYETDTISAPPQC